MSRRSYRMPNFIFETAFALGARAPHTLPRRQCRSWREFLLLPKASRIHELRSVRIRRYSADRRSAFRIDYNSAAATQDRHERAAFARASSYAVLKVSRPNWGPPPARGRQLTLPSLTTYASYAAPVTYVGGRSLTTPIILHSAFGPALPRGKSRAIATEPPCTSSLLLFAEGFSQGARKRPDEVVQNRTFA